MKLATKALPGDRAGRRLAFRFLAVLLGWLTVAGAAERSYDPNAPAEAILDALLAEPVAFVKPPAWQAELEVRQGAGHARNVLYSPFAAQNSVYSSTEAELFALRQQPRSFHQSSLYAFGSHSHYFDLAGNNDEYSALARSSWEYRDDARGACGLRADYSYFDQFFDASISDAEIDATHLKQHDVGASTFVSHVVRPGLSAELGGAYKHAFVEQSSDDYRQAEASFTLKGDARSRLTWALSYGYRVDDYVDREKRTAVGEPIAGEPVAVASHQVAVQGAWFWDAARHWKTRWRFAGRTRDDDGGGYYNYDYWLGSLGLVGRMGRWRLELGADYADTQYDTRPSDFVDDASAPLHRERWDLGGRLERELGKRWKAFATLDWEDNAANSALDAYEHFAGSAGLACTLTTAR